MKGSSGFTLVELLAVVMLLGIMAAFALPSVISANKTWENASNQIAGNFKLARAKAVSKTSAYRIKPISLTEFQVSYATKCSEPNINKWTVDYTFDVKMPEKVELVTPTKRNGTTQANLLDWGNEGVNGIDGICFNSRGAANKELIITIEDKVTRNKKTIQVLRGGKVKIDPI